MQSLPKKAVGECTLDRADNPRAPAGGVCLGAWFPAGKDILSATGVSGAGVNLLNRFDLRLCQALWTLRAFAEKYRRIEMAGTWILDNAVLDRKSVV